MRNDDWFDLLAATLWQHMEAQLAPECPEQRPRIIRLAANGFTPAHLALMVYANTLREAGEPRPDDLEDYVFHMALRGFKPAKRMANVRRDMAICDVIRALYEGHKRVDEKHQAETGNNACLVAIGYDRGPATDEDSAISLVWKALSRVGVHVTEDAVRKVWQRKA